jgi:hypothetical protein
MAPKTASALAEPGLAPMRRLKSNTTNKLLGNKNGKASVITVSGCVLTARPNSS